MNLDRLCIPPQYPEKSIKNTICNQHPWFVFWKTTTTRPYETKTLYATLAMP